MKQLLLIIDAQEDLIEGVKKGGPVYQKEQLIANINKVIGKAQASQTPIACVRDLCVADGVGKGFQVHHEIQVPEGTPYFDKSATNAFFGTKLAEYLKQQEIQHVVIAGCQTEFCIDTAVRTATYLKMWVTLVGDGHATFDSEVLSAAQIIAHHNHTLHEYDNDEYFCLVRNSEEDLFQPTHSLYLD